MWWKYLIVIIVSYFIGNISFARIISAKKKKDITKQGSGNPGTMNMLRTFGFKTGLLTLLLDAFKGACGAMLGFFMFGGAGATIGFLGLNAPIEAITGLYVGGFAVTLGHNFPVLYKFKGGKGVACILGVYLVASPIWVAASFVFCFIYLYIFDYAAVASFIFLTILTFIQALKYKGELVVSLLLFFLYFMTVYAHRMNFYRLLTGKENKVNLKRSLKKLYGKKEVKAEKKEIKAEIKNDKKEEIG